MLTTALNRPGDLAARYGGEEFAAILPDTDAEGAMTIAESIRAAVRGLAIPHDGSRSMVVTASVGVSAFTGNGAVGSVETLVQEADNALYAAKAAGRDRVVMGRGEARPAGGRPAGRPSGRRDLARRFGGLALALFLLDLLAGRLVDDLHRQAHLAALVEAEELDPDLVAFLDHVGGLVDAAAQPSWEMWTRPSLAPKKLTKAPKSTVFTTVP